MKNGDRICFMCATLTASHLDGKEHLLPVPGIPHSCLHADPAGELAVLRQRRWHRADEETKRTRGRDDALRGATRGMVIDHLRLLEFGSRPDSCRRAYIMAVVVDDDSSGGGAILWEQRRWDHSSGLMWDGGRVVVAVS